jgi:hypothetical protein
MNGIRFAQSNGCKKKIHTQACDSSPDHPCVPHISGEGCRFIHAESPSPMCCISGTHDAQWDSRIIAEARAFYGRSLNISHLTYYDPSRLVTQCHVPRQPSSRIDKHSRPSDQATICDNLQADADAGNLVLSMTRSIFDYDDADGCLVDCRYGDQKLEMAKMLRCLSRCTPSDILSDRIDAQDLVTSTLMLMETCRRSGLSLQSCQRPAPGCRIPIFSYNQ